MQRIPILVERADRVSTAPLQSIPPGRVDASGTINTYGVPAGQYFVRIGGAPPPWTVRSVMSEGRDVSDVPLDIGAADVTNVIVTFTDRPAKPPASFVAPLAIPFWLPSRMSNPVSGSIRTPCSASCRWGSRSQSATANRRCRTSGSAAGADAEQARSAGSRRRERARPNRAVIRRNDRVVDGSPYG